MPNTTERLAFRPGQSTAFAPPGHHLKQQQEQERLAAAKANALATSSAMAMEEEDDDEVSDSACSSASSSMSSSSSTGTPLSPPSSAASTPTSASSAMDMEDLRHMEDEEEEDDRDDEDAGAENDCHLNESKMPQAKQHDLQQPLQGKKMDVKEDDEEDSGADTHKIIVFDWDDTLLPSSFLAEHGLRLDTTVPEAVVRELAELEDGVLKLIKLAMGAAAEVHVITNAEAGWVELSAAKFMPRVAGMLKQLIVLSARSTFEPAYPNEPLAWKVQAFKRQLAEDAHRLNPRKTMVLSLGDSHVEREAVLTVTGRMPKTIVKSVKFAERPSMSQLRSQIELVVSCFSYVIDEPGCLDLMLTIQVSQQ